MVKGSDRMSRKSGEEGKEGRTNKGKKNEEEDIIRNFKPVNSIKGTKNDLKGLSWPVYKKYE